MRSQFWRIANGDGAGWGGRIHIGRLSFGYLAYRHDYWASPDRWVFQPQITYDRGRMSRDKQLRREIQDVGDLRRAGL